MAKVSAAWIELGRSFHQEGTVNEKFNCSVYYLWKDQYGSSKKDPKEKL